jgi:hypothetical protein
MLYLVVIIRLEPLPLLLSPLLFTPLLPTVTTRVPPLPILPTHHNHRLPPLAPLITIINYQVVFVDLSVSETMHNLLVLAKSHQTERANLFAEVAKIQKQFKVLVVFKTSNSCILCYMYGKQTFKCVDHKSRRDDKKND